MSYCNCCLKQSLPFISDHLAHASNEIRQKLWSYMSIFHPAGPQHQTRMIDFRYSTCVCSVSKCACINLHPALHSNVVSLWWYQRVQLCLVSSLSSVHRGDGQHDQIVIANHQFWAVPVCFYLTERTEHITNKWFHSRKGQITTCCSFI